MILDGNNLSHDDVLTALSIQSQDQKNAKQKQASCKLDATKERIQKLTDKLIKAGILYIIYIYIYMMLII
jgi:hypothetical protein